MGVLATRKVAMIHIPIPGIQIIECTPSEFVHPQAPSKLVNWIIVEVDCLWVHIEDFISVAVRRGTEVLYAKHTELSDQDVQAFLMSIPFAALIYQRKEIAVHGSALIAPPELKPRGATIILGTSGAGKSTTSAALALNKWLVMCDDICRIGILARESDRTWSSPKLYAGYSRIKLTDSSFAILEFDKTNLDQVSKFVEKYYFDPPTSWDGETGIASFVILNRSSSAVDFSWGSCRPEHIEAALLPNLYRHEIGLIISPDLKDLIRSALSCVRTMVLTAPKDASPLAIATQIERCEQAYR